MCFWLKLEEESELRGGEYTKGGFSLKPGSRIKRGLGCKIFQGKSGTEAETEVKWPKLTF